jgi:hypothetical protein
VTGIPWRLIGVGTAALVVGLLLWRVSEWREGYLERDAAEARAETAEDEKLRLAETFAAATELNRSLARDLAAFREEEATRGQELRDAIKAKPLHREVIHVNPTTGEKTTCNERDPVRYGELFNKAVGPAYP